MQNTMQKFRQSSIVVDKPGILSGNLKPLTSSNYPAVQYFLLKLRKRFLLTNVCKRMYGIFLFCLDLFQNVLVFIDLFIDIIPIISSIQIAHDVKCVHHVIQ